MCSHSPVSIRGIVLFHLAVPVPATSHSLQQFQQKLHAVTHRSDVLNHLQSKGSAKQRDARDTQFIARELGNNPTSPRLLQEVTLRREDGSGKTLAPKPASSLLPNQPRTSFCITSPRFSLLPTASSCLIFAAMLQFCFVKLPLTTAKTPTMSGFRL